MYKQAKYASTRGRALDQETESARSAELSTRARQWIDQESESEREARSADLRTRERQWVDQETESEREARSENKSEAVDRPRE